MRCCADRHVFLRFAPAGHYAALCLLALSVVCHGSARAQTAVPAAVPAPAQAAPPADPLGRTTPRGTVLGFLKAARKGDDDAAVQYLNTTLRDKDAAALAQQLFTVLNRRLPARLNELSDQPEGSLPFPAQPNVDLVGTIRGAGGDTDILLERIQRNTAEPVWLFSRKTLDSIPELYAAAGLPALYFALAFLNRVLSRVAGPVRRRLQERGDREASMPGTFRTRPPERGKRPTITAA